MLRREYLFKCLEMDSGFINSGLCNLKQTSYREQFLKVGHFLKMCLKTLES